MNVFFNRFITCVLCLGAIISVSAAGKVTSPDFAFPKKVAKTAEADLNIAISADNAPGALEALIRLYLADYLIDPESAQLSIKKVEEVAANMAGSDFAPMYDALLARMYFGMYNANSWNYDRRELPLTPLPEDLTEWSGEQFKNRISSLCASSCAKPQLLTKLKTASYPGIVSCEKSSLPFYPTLQDFAYANAISLEKSIGYDSINSFYLSAKANATTTASEILWTMAATEARQPDTDTEELAKLYLEAYRKYHQSEYSAILLEKYASLINDIFDGASTSYSSLDSLKAQTEECLAEINTFTSKFKSSRFVPNLNREKASILCRRLSANYASFCMPGQEVEVSVESRNAKAGNILVYKFSKSPKNRWDFGYNYKDGILVKTIPFKFEDNAPFIASKKIGVKIDKPGYYRFIVSEGKRPEREDYYNDAIRCVPAIPMAFSSNNSSYIAVCNPVTGQPMPGVKVSITDSRQDKSVPVNVGVTNADGLVNVTEKIKENQSYYVSLTIDNVNYPYPDIYLGNGSIYSGKQTNATIDILTDRSLYHRGDSVHFLGVAHMAKRNASSSPTVREIVTDTKLTFVLYDANNQSIDTISGISDQYGRVAGSFATPTDGLSGDFYIRATMSLDKTKYSGHARFTVSDYRMPDFRIETQPAMLSTPKAGWVTIKGTATSYAGAPMAGTSVEALLRVRPRFVWWIDQHTPFIFSATATTDATGAFSIEIPDSVFNADPAQKTYAVSLNATSMAGSSADASVFFSTGKQYFLDFGNIPANIDGSKPFTVPVTVKNTAGDNNDIPLRWALVSDADTLATGSIATPIDLKNIKPAIYTLCVGPEDSALADSISTSVSIFNTATDIVPGKSPLWVKSGHETVALGTQSLPLLIGTPLDSASVYCITLINGQWRSIKRLDLGKGYHSVSIDCSGLAHGQSGEVRLFSINHFGVASATIRIDVESKKPMQIIGESFRDKLVAGESETWNIRLANADGTPAQGAMVLDMFNQALSALSTHSISINPISLYTNAGFRQSYAYRHLIYSRWSQILKHFGMESLTEPSFNFYGIYIPGRPQIYIRGAKRALYGSAAGVAVVEDAVVNEMKMAPAMSNSRMADADYAEEETEITEEANEGATEITETKDFDFRDSDVPLAIWAPTLTSDKDGNISYTFTVPNANTTWQLISLAWTKDMDAATMMRTFVASKPIMVMPNAPRFLRAGDVCMVPAQIVNDSDEEITAITVVEIFNPATGNVISTQKFKNKISAHGSAVATAKVTANADLSALGYRVRSSNGKFSDGEQMAIPVLPSEAQLVETYPFYLNPGDSIYSTTLPKNKDARLSLTFTENPAWTIVSALPGLRKDPGSTANSAATAIFSASIAKGIMRDNPSIAKAIKTWLDNPADSALKSMLAQNEDLKIALLNSTPWVQAAQSDDERMARLSLLFSDKETDASIKAAVATLGKLQRPDGGFAWGRWCDESSQCTTANVLAMIADLKTTGNMPQNNDLAQMVSKAVTYYDNCIKRALDRADNKKHVTDELYAIIRPQVSDKEIPLAGRTVIANTTNSIASDWKSMTDPATKAIAAQALFLNNYKSLSKQLMASISEFGVWSKDQGLRFPSVNALYTYAILLKTYSMVLPQSKEIDGLRQQLIVRKQGDDWGSAVVTTEVVSSILSSGSKWTVDAKGATITAGGSDIRPTSPMQTATGAIRANLTPYAGKKLTISTTGTGPAYGSVYAQFKQTMTEVKAAACEDLDIEKSVTVRRGTEWAPMPKTLKVGDRVKVQLTIHCKRNLSYVTITDQRPAAFQPVQQLPGWLYSEGVAFYRENGDSSTNLYVVQMSPGTYLLTYEMNVGQAGSYTSGVASIQSQYAPEISAHSSGSSLKISEK